MTGYPEYLYRVSFREGVTSPWLTPRIPCSAAQMEDKATERVCLADSIEHCIQAISPDARNLCIGAEIAVYRLKVSDLRPEKLVSPKDVFDIGFVPDALFNQEWWYLDKVQADLRHAVIKDFEACHVLNWTIIDEDQVRGALHAAAPDVLALLPYGGTAQDGPHAMYETAMDQLWQDRRFDECDMLYDILAELPWAQTLEVSRLDLIWKD